MSWKRRVWSTPLRLTRRTRSPSLQATIRQPSPPSPRRSSRGDETARGRAWGPLERIAETRTVILPRPRRASPDVTVRRGQAPQSALWLTHEAHVRRPALADDDGGPARRAAHPVLVRPAMDWAGRVFVRPGRADAAGRIGQWRLSTPAAAARAGAAPASRRRRPSRCGIRGRSRLSGLPRRSRWILLARAA